MNANSPGRGPNPSRNKKRLLRLVGPLSLSVLASAGCTSDSGKTGAEPAQSPASPPANEHSCGSGCGATGCGGPKKTAEEKTDKG